MTWFVVALVAVILIGDFCYSRYVASRLRNWEKTVNRNSDGVMVGCEAFSLGGQDAQTAVLLVHGINDTPYCWRKMAPELAKSFHVRAMRLPGFGEPIPEYMKGDAEQWIAAIKSEALALHEDHEKVYIVAHSLGGAATIQLMLGENEKQAELADGLILLAPAIQVSNQRSPVLPTRFWHNVGKVLVFTQTTYNPFGNDAQDPNERQAKNRVRFSPRHVIDETFKLIDANQGHEARVTLPVLMVLSDKDNVNDYQASVEWMKDISSERKETFWNNRSGHALQYDLGWDSVAQAIKEFVEN